MHSWKRADLHMHTSFSGWRSLRLIDPQDCYVAPEAAFAAARQKGMDFVCFTDHDTIDGALDFLARHPESESRVIVGEEVEANLPDSRQWIHVNVYGVDERLHEDLVRLRGNCFELLAELRSRRLLFVLNHPFQSFRSIRTARRHLAALLPLFPAAEVSNSTSPPSHREVLLAMLHGGRAGPKGLVGGSDAHTLSRIAAVYTAAPGETKTEFLESIRQGVCAISGQAPGLLALIRDVYLVVGAYYGQLYGRHYPLGTWRRLKNIGFSGLLLPAAVGGLPAILTTVQTLRQEWIARFGSWELLSGDLVAQAAAALRLGREVPHPAGMGPSPD